MDTKIALDMEIAVYRRLLESEEDRLGIAMDGGGGYNDEGKGFLKKCSLDGLVTRVIPPTPATTRTEQSTSRWSRGRNFTEL